MRKAIVVGLTGQTGAGKSTVAGMLKKFGYAVIDADETAALVTAKGSPVLKELSDAFGPDILDEHGELKRSVLADRAFSSEEGTRRLNQITHPEILRLIRKKINGKFFDGYEAVILDAPQLFESGLNEECTLVISVTAPKDLRLLRITERDGITAAEAEKRMSAQLPEDYFRKNSDIILENTGTEETLHGQVTRAAQILDEVIGGKTL